MSYVNNHHIVEIVSSKIFIDNDFKLITNNNLVLINALDQFSNAQVIMKMSEI